MRPNLRVAAAPILLLAAALVFFGKSSDTNVITLTPSGFSPSRLVVDLGDTVTFVSTAGKPFWPASDLHPSHSVYSEFDPRMPVSATSSWSFTFDRPGVWKYHDHLESGHGGEVAVRGGFEENCSEESENPNCFKGKMLKELRENGLSAAFDLMAELYEKSQAFRDVCHDNTHSLGEAAYDLFEKGDLDALSPKTSYCGYGFYHGFMERMVQVSGSLAEAKVFCERAGDLLSRETSDAEGACYHGIGHGVLDGSDPSAWGSADRMVESPLSLCKKLTDDLILVDRCASGVFNSLAILSHDPTYGIEIDRSDPYALCRSFDESYFKKPCHEELNTVVLGLGKDFGESALLVEKVEDDASAWSAMSSLAGYYAQSKLDPSDFDAVARECLSLPDRLVSACVTGFAGGLIEAGSPGKEYKLALLFCDYGTIKGSFRTDCYERVAWLVKYTAPESVREEMCASAAAGSRDIFCKS